MFLLLAWQCFVQKSIKHLLCQPCWACFVINQEKKKSLNLNFPFRLPISSFKHQTKPFTCMSTKLSCITFPMATVICQTQFRLKYKKSFSFKGQNSKTQNLICTRFHSCWDSLGWTNFHSCLSKRFQDKAQEMLRMQLGINVMC